MPADRRRLAGRYLGCLLALLALSSAGWFGLGAGSIRAAPHDPPPPQPTGLTALHRSGQTFLTWQEVGTVTGAAYHVYRSNLPISAVTLGSARRLTTQWGPLPAGSSVFWSERAHPSGPQLRNYVISDLAAPLTDTIGLFVWTPKESGQFYYAVTTVLNGVENRAEFISANSLSSPVAETPAAPQPVRAVQSADGLSAIYTQFLDYETYNPTLNLVTADRPGHDAAAGQPQYAYNYSLFLPQPRACGGTPPANYPLVLYLHGYSGRYNNSIATDTNTQCAAAVYGDDPARTWYFGHSATYDYRRGGVPDTGPLVNYSEARLLQIISDAERGYGLAGRVLDPQRVYVQGSSMGGSGALALGVRYPNVFAAVLADLPMTNHRAATGTETPPGCCPWYGFTASALWGYAEQHLAVHLIGPAAAPLAAYEGTPIWDWHNQQQELLTRRAADTALVSVGHGTLDTTIHWQSQGQPFYAPLYQSRRTFTGATRLVDHSVGTGTAAVGPMTGGAGEPFHNWQVRRDETVPALSYASGSSVVPPPADRESNYNLNLEWGASWHPIAGGQPPVDSVTVWAMDLRTTDGSSQIVDVTPRRRQAFIVRPAATYGWENRRLSDGLLLQSGQAVGDADQLVTAAGVLVDGAGSRLTIRLLAVAPSATPTPSRPPTPAPTVSPSATPCAVTFSDAQPTDYFYAPLGYLLCRQAISGYSDGTFRPYATATRAQLSKMVVRAFALPLDTTGSPHFHDVAPADTFFPFIETAVNRGILSGYSDGNFYPQNPVTRAQTAKIIVKAAGWTLDTAGGPHFVDVPPNDAFYAVVETAYAHGMIGGYNSGNGPQFRPAASSARAQITKMLYLGTQSH